MSKFDASHPKIVEVLSGANVAVIGTVTNDGAPHLAAVWFEWRDSHIIVVTPATAQKVAHIQANPHVEVCINTGVSGPCATAIGRAELAGVASSTDIEHIATRYLGRQAAAEYVSRRPKEAQSVLIRVHPERWRLYPPG